MQRKRDPIAEGILDSDIGDKTASASAAGWGNPIDGTVPALKVYSCAHIWLDRWIEPFSLKVLQEHVLNNVIELHILAQTSEGYTITSAANNISRQNISGVPFDGQTIVARCDVPLEKRNIVRSIRIDSWKYVNKRVELLRKSGTVCVWDNARQTHMSVHRK